MLGGYIHIKEFEQNKVVAISQVVTLEKGVNTFMCLFDLPEHRENVGERK